MGSLGFDHVFLGPAIINLLSANHTNQNESIAGLWSNSVTLDRDIIIIDRDIVTENNTNMVEIIFHQLIDTNKIDLNDSFTWYTMNRYRFQHI